MGTDNQNIQEGAQTTDTKTFTQAELDAVFKDRLKREREKYSDYEDLKAKAAKFDEAEEANKTELQKVTERAKALEDELNGLKEAEKLRTMRAEVAKETGIPANLLTGSTEDECKAQAEAIKAFAQPQGYPKVRDSSGLSVQTSSVANGATTKAQFKDWFESNF
jgi:predicted  nucleic acid-binding Zn-ribbon protein